MTIALAPIPLLSFLDNNGKPAAKYKLFTYQAGSTTKQATYTDGTGGTPNTNPIILDARGECHCWLTPNVAYKFVFASPTDSDPPSNPIWTVDNLNTGIAGITSDVTPAVDNTYSLGTSVLRWLNVLISGAFKIVNSGFSSSIQLAQTLSGNRQVSLVDADLLVGGSIPLVVTTNTNSLLSWAGHTIINDSSSSYTYTMIRSSSLAQPWVAGTVIEFEQKGAGGITVAPGSGVTILGFGASASANISLEQGQRIRLKNIGSDVWTAYDVSVTTGSFTPTWSGFSSAPTCFANYLKIGSFVTMTFNVSGSTGTSNANSMQITNIPAAIRQSTGGGSRSPIYVVDNGVETIGSFAFTSAGVISFSIGSPPSTSGFTNSGTKGVPLFSSISWNI